MEQRRFGRTGHMSTVAILGAFSLGEIPQAEADALLEQAVAAGINHIDVAPSYGEAELRLGPWLARERQRFFVGCKTMERTREGAASELRSSLKRLQIEQLDLYQAHAITTMEELDQITRRGGALEAMLAARDEGLTRYLGITGHGWQAPTVFLEALRRFDFDTILFPVNFVLYANPAYHRAAQQLLRECQARDVGVMAIKAAARSQWGETPKIYDTWYRPFDDQQHIQDGVDFALSQEGVTGLCTAGEAHIFPMFVQACQKYQPMSPERQAALMATAQEYEPIWA